MDFEKLRKGLGKRLEKRFGKPWKETGKDLEIGLRKSFG